MATQPRRRLISHWLTNAQEVKSNCRSQLEVAGPRWSQGLARESPGPPGILDGTWAHKIQSGKVSFRKVCDFSLDLLMDCTSFLQQICFPQCSSLLQPCPDWVLRCSNILCEPAEIREWNIKPRSPELVAFHPSI